MRFAHRTMRTRMWLSSGLATGMVAWAASWPPHTGPAASRTILHQAHVLGACDVPQAATHVRMADEALEQASRLVQNDDNRRATYALMRAEADATLALALAREAPARAEAHDALDQVQSFPQEIAQ